MYFNVAVSPIYGSNNDIFDMIISYNVLNFVLNMSGNYIAVKTKKK